MDHDPEEQISPPMRKLFRPVKVFYCYDSKDEYLLKKLEEHLSPLKHSKKIVEWSDREIQAGMDWANEIEIHLNTADIILLLVSPSFIASDICYSEQMQKALERQQKGNARVIPIILRPTLWAETPIGKIQGLPRNNRAITQWSNRDAAFLDVVRDIWVIIKDIHRISPYSLVAGTAAGLAAGGTIGALILPSVGTIVGGVLGGLFGNTIQRQMQNEQIKEIDAALFEAREYEEQE